MVISKLRKIVNGSKIGRAVNESSIGKSFERSPPVLAIEVMISASKVFKEEPHLIPAMPVVAVIVYPLLLANFYEHKIRNPNGFQEFVSYHLDRLRPNYRENYT